MSSVHPRDRLSTSDPKCANCRHWAKVIGGPPSIAVCEVNRLVARGSVAGRDLSFFYTTDLMLCSRWESCEGC